MFVGPSTKTKFITFQIQMEVVCNFIFECKISVDKSCMHAVHGDAGKSIIGGGGGGRYSYIHVLHHLFPLKAIVFTVCEHEYI
jgi:hypothetical protein